MAKHGGFYDESPEMKRDDDGKMGVKKSEKTHHEGKGKEESVASDLEVHSHHARDRREMKHRHIKEHMDMHAKHQHEHALHEHMGNGHKGEMHARHHSELKDLHGRHEKEMKEMHTRHEKHMGATGGQAAGEPIEKIEEGKKE